MDCCVFIFICFQKPFDFFLDLIINHIHCLMACYSISMNLSLFEVFPWGWFLVLVFCGQRKCLIWFWFPWICWGLLCVLSCGLSLKIFHVHLKRLCILLLWGERLSIYLFSPFDLMSHSVPQYPCWYFVWKIYPFLQWGVKISHYNCVLSTSFLKSSKNFVIYLGACMLGACIYIQCLCLLDGFFPWVLWSVLLCLFLWPLFWSLLCQI